jgi:hypothetical protein
MSRLLRALLLIGIVSIANLGYASTPCPGCSDATYILLAQNSRATEARLRTVIGELQRGNPNYEQMEPTLRIAVRQQLPAMQGRLKSLGSINTISFEGQQNGADVYEVKFTNGFTMWMIGLSPDGKIAILWVQ